MLHDFESLLAHELGLDAESVGHELIARAVQERLARSGAPDREAYWALVTRSPAELQALIEAVVVVETWFFRDPEAFATLAREATGAWASDIPGGALRVLSLPCATGEEAYSIAMTLLDAGLGAGRFAVDGVDISEQALGRARDGVYGSNSFRGKDLDFRSRYFERVAAGYRLREECRGAVSFRAGNLLSADVMLGTACYSAIFCRNVLIYLDRAAQQRALEVLLRLLAPGGLLFVGPSETSLLPSRDFAPLRIPLAFAFRKLGPASQRPRLAATVKGPAPARASAGKPAPVRARAPVTSGGTSPRAELDAEAHLALVASLADRGELAEAYRRCTDHERRYGSSARLFYLMGLLREAAQQLDEAATFHKKAIYLDPNHEEALTHLALLLDKQGDAAGAARIRQRARRSSTREGT